MLEIFTNSILYPKTIVNYHNKKGGFIFLYLLVLITMMTISTFVFYISYKKPVIDYDNFTCAIAQGKILCDESHDVNDSLDIYDFDLYLLNENQSISDISSLSDFALVVQETSLSVVVANRQMSNINLLAGTNIDSLAEVVRVLEISVIIAGSFMGLLSNTLIIMFIILISTIPFIRFKKDISYKKIFKMVVFATTPMAFLFTIYNLVNFTDIIFFILMFVAYRSVFALQRELYFRTLMKTSYHGNQEEEVVEEEIDEDDIE
jgi:hypothetical protein